MAHNSRHDEIIKIISRLKKVTVQELTERLHVSEATIRKDLTILEDMAIITRTHGGAMLAEDVNNFPSLKNRKEVRLPEKLAIVERAKELISDGDTIYIDSGTTCELMARVIKGMNIRVICHSVGALAELIEAPGMSIIMLGGNFRPDGASFIGPMAVENIKRFQIETCFLGAAAFTEEGIFMSQNMIEAQLKAETLKVSRRRIILCDSSKYGKPAFSVFARPGDIDVLITDRGFPDKKRFEAFDMEVITV
ncbi:MAG TPA: DeoR/GlpR family DNA-binding transcription regulator [Spirochaetia bacterium]|nr:DeoR/GlpR family DNA-binding transcription regulator [Spirochaetia bacterium]